MVVKIAQNGLFDKMSKKAGTLYKVGRLLGFADMANFYKYCKRGYLPNRYWRKAIDNFGVTYEELAAATEQARKI